MTDSAFTANLSQMVTNFHQGHIHLAHDLECIHDHLATEKPEAAVIHCGRVLEGLARAKSIEQEAPKPGQDLSLDLSFLKDGGHMGGDTLFWANAIRSRANDVRHLKADVKMGTAKLMARLTEKIVEWFFEPTDEAITKEGQLFADKDSDDALEALDRWKEALDGEGAPEEALDDLTAPADLLFIRAEILIDKDQFCAAVRILDQPGLRMELRARQLRGLWHSRRSHHLEGSEAMESVDEAIRILKLTLEDWRGDSETLGILGGAYKRRAFLKKQVGDSDGYRKDLTRSLNCYKAGDGRPYLRINQAALELWLDRPEESRRLAIDVIKDLEKIKKRAGARRDPKWDAPTFAEAFLLAGRFGDAARMYRPYLRPGSGCRGGHREVAELQLARHLEHLGLGNVETSADNAGSCEPGFLTRYKTDSPSIDTKYSIILASESNSEDPDVTSEWVEAIPTGSRVVAPLEGLPQSLRKWLVANAKELYVTLVTRRLPQFPPPGGAGLFDDGSMLRGADEVVWPTQVLSNESLRMTRRAEALLPVRIEWTRVIALGDLDDRLSHLLGLRMPRNFIVANDDAAVLYEEQQAE